MTIFDLVFLAAALACAGALVVAVGALALRRWSTARRTLIGLACYVMIYAIALVGVAALSPQRSLPMGQARCFDDWCITVAQAVRQPTLDAGAMEVAARGSFLVVTVRVTSQAKRVSQRELGAYLSLVDGAARRYDVSPAGQRALDAAGQSGQPLDTLIAPGGSFTHVVVFDTPADASQCALVVTHSAFPGAFIIGDDQSLLHRPTLLQVSLTP
jgi:hypothetical protein